jgi:transposase
LLNQESECSKVSEIMGRPTKLTPEKHDKIVELVRAGNYVDTASAVAGVAEQTFYVWMSKGEGEKARSPYKEFREAITAARAEAEARMVLVVQRAANDGSWQAASWYLERTKQAKFGKQNRVELTGAEGGAVKVDVTVDELEQRIANLLDKA